MTSDKMDDSIKNNMLNDFLSDEDKPKPPKPVYPSRSEWSGSYDGYSPRSYSGQGSLLDDDGPDPLDRDYERAYGSDRTKGKMTNTYTGAGSGYSRRTSLISDPIEKDYGRQLAAVMRSAYQNGGKVFMENVDVTDATKIIMKAMGELLDRANVSWGTSGMQDFKQAIADLFPNSFYDGKRIVLDKPVKKTAVPRLEELGPDEVMDADTGEIIDEAEEERKAIIQFDGDEQP